MFLAHWMWLAADWITYYLDVKLIGYGGVERKQSVHRACHKCGWSNCDLSIVTNKEEKQFLKGTYKLRKHLNRSIEQNPFNKHNRRSL